MEHLNYLPLGQHERLPIRKWNGQNCNKDEDSLIIFDRLDAKHPVALDVGVPNIVYLEEEHEPSFGSPDEESYVLDNEQPIRLSY